MKEGPYVYQNICLSTTKTIQQSTTVVFTPDEPPPSKRVKVQYEEDGEVFEQEDTYNNVTGEATITVPAHGNNTAVEVILQEATVSNKKLGPC